MKVINEISFGSYNTRSSAQSFLNRIVCEGKAELLDAVLTDMYPDGISENELDDILDYEEEDVCRWLDMRSETDVRSDITDKEAEIEEYKDAIHELELDIASYEAQLLNGDSELDEDELTEQIEDARSDISTYEDDITAATEELNDLEEELDEILSY